MKKTLTILMILTMSVVSVFAVEKSKTFGDFTVYFDTEDVDKCYINPQETALRQNLKIFQKMPAYKIKQYKGSVRGYSIIKEEAENGKGNKYRDYLLCTALIIRNNLAGGRICERSPKGTPFWTYIFKDSKGNLYYASKYLDLEDLE